MQRKSFKGTWTITEMKICENIENRFGPDVSEPFGLSGTRSQYASFHPIRTATVVVIARSMYKYCVSPRLVCKVK